MKNSCGISDSRKSASFAILSKSIDYYAAEKAGVELVGEIAMNPERLYGRDNSFSPLPPLSIEEKLEILEDMYGIDSEFTELHRKFSELKKQNEKTIQGNVQSQMPQTLDL